MDISAMLFSGAIGGIIGSLIISVTNYYIFKQHQKRTNVLVHQYLKFVCRIELITPAQYNQMHHAISMALEIIADNNNNIHKNDIIQYTEFLDEARRLSVLCQHYEQSEYKNQKSYDESRNEWIIVRDKFAEKYKIKFDPFSKG